MHRLRWSWWRRLAAAGAAAGFLLLSIVACGMGAAQPAGSLVAGAQSGAVGAGDSAVQAAADVQGSTARNGAAETASSGEERRGTPTPRARRTPTATPTRAPPTRIDGLPVIYVDQLPRQARDTLRLIERGGPFPYEKDGAVFQNREGLLPSRPRGYYREYTVITPGENDRGARRIVAGEDGELYYTADHYDSFSRILQR